MSEQGVAVFDLDGTITDGDTYLAFLLFALRRQPGRLARCPALLPAVLQFRLGRLSRDDLKQRFLKAILGGVASERVAIWSAQFVQICQQNMVKPAALERIEHHRGQGHRLILATASLDIYAEPLGRLLGFDTVVATKIAFSNGRVSGALAGPNLLGAFKTEALLRTGVPAKPRGVEVTAYSDHHSDLPLLHFADQAVAVDPSPALAAEAVRYGFKVERWKPDRRGSQPAAQPPR